jgi:hypothetical protein
LPFLKNNRLKEKPHIQAAVFFTGILNLTDRFVQTFGGFGF